MTIWGSRMSKNKSEKTYRKIKKLHIWATLVQFVLIAAALALVFAFAVQYIALYAIDSKMASEYEKISYMARLYENGLKNNDENIYNLLVEEGHDYIILNADGELLHLNGVNTCGEESGVVALPGYDEDVTVYRDTERGFVYPKNNRLALDIKHFREWMSDEDNEAETDIENVVMQHQGALNLPIWIAKDVDGGNRRLICKAEFSMGRRDVDMFSGIIIVMLILIGVLLISFLVTPIRNIIRQRRMLDLFFTDVVTEGHNSTWLLVKGENMLRKKMSARNKFAVVNLRFVNYNTFSVCHSAAEGEAVLGKLYHKIYTKLKKNEMCAHLGSGNFGLILKYGNEDELRVRLGGLIGELEQMEPDHKFAFRAGVSMSDKAKDDEGRPIKPRDIEFNSEFNHATAARMSLGAGEDSGIAFFDDKLIDQQKWRDKVQERQQAALDNKEFVVYYQPKYDPRTSTLRGAEALIRWNSPELGFVSPGQFIPIFEENGFITQIDHYMLEHVAADQKAWLDKGLKCVPVSVNVSRAHFIESDLAEQIRDIVDKAGTPHEYIEIELTESAFFDDKKAMLTTISKLKGYGFAVSMDDFGSGYSSLNSLKDMPLDVLKLDAEFFRGENNDKRAEIVVSEAIKLAKNLNMRIVAEGVELKDQVDFLAGEGCDMIQGYYFDKPMPCDEYETRMSQ